MSSSRPARTTGRRTRLAILAALVAVSAAFIAVLQRQSSAASPSSTGSPVAVQPLVPRPQLGPHGDRHGEVGEADGVVPDGVTVFDDQYAAVAKLDPALLRALRRAATDAKGHGVTFYVDSGWRSRAYQEELFRQAVSKYGSNAKAAHWVATPGTSAHESGEAVDIGHSDAAGWLSEHAAKYGLCQIYSNEPWHYELRPDAVDHGCPAKYADPTHDPRIQQ